MPARRSAAALRPRLEPLEDRVVPTSSLSVSDATVAEGNAGTVDMVFTITRTGDLSAPLTVNYSTANGTASAGSDYAIRSGTVTFAPGVGTAEVRVPVIGDQLDEPDETFTLSLTGPVLGSGAPFGFAPRQTNATGVAPVAIATADLNADGNPDLAVANRDTGGVSVHLNSTLPGSATVTFTPRVDIVTGGEAHGVAVGDVNGDGKPDVAVANRSSGTVTVLLNTTPAGGGTASFAAGVNFSTPSPQSVTIGDVNADGKPDLVLASPSGGHVAVLLNTTPTGGTVATFTGSQTFPTGGTPLRVLLADVNGDGKPDVVTGNRGGTGGTLKVQLNTTPAGAASATLAAVQSFAVVDVPLDMMVGDLNGDGRPDFVVSGSNAICVRLNTTPAGSATVTTAARQDFAGGVSPQGMAIADIDGDGKPDVVVANRNDTYSSVPADNTVSLFRNETPGGATQVTFALRQDVPAGRGALDVVAADMNGDGRRDLAVADRYDDTLSVFLQGEFTVVDGVGVGTITDDDAPPIPNGDVAARSASSGGWTVLRSTGSAFESRAFGGWNPTAGWRDVLSGDFNGDGRADAAGRTSGGAWFVGVNTGTQFANALWTVWSSTVEWLDVSVGDFNGDGRDDIAGRTAGGAWFVGTSTGSGFINALGTIWNGSAGWRDVSVADFDGDGKSDIAGRTADGSWWVGTSTGTGFVNALWTNWNEAANWRDVRVDDFNGDGRADVAGRTANGAWFVGTSTGTGFVNALWTVWNESAGWRDVLTGDFDGDGKADIAGRTSGGAWFVGRSTASGFVNALWDVWNESAGWGDVVAADFDGDGKADIAGRTGDQWWVGLSTGSGLLTAPWGAFPVGGPYVDVLGGDFAA